MSYFLDAFTVIIVVIFAALGYKKGVLKTFVSLGGSILASILSAILSKPIAAAIYNSIFKRTVISKSEEAMKYVLQHGGSYVDEFLKSLPGFMSSSISKFGITPADISAQSEQGAVQVERTLAPVFISFISVITAIVLFIALMIAVKLICRMIYRALDGTTIGTFDSAAGAVVGILEGFIIVMLAAFVMRISVPHMQNVPTFMSDSAISQSIVYKGVYNSPIVTKLVSDVSDSPNTAEIE